MSLPVVEAGELVGVVSLADYLPLLQHLLPVESGDPAGDE